MPSVHYTRYLAWPDGTYELFDPEKLFDVNDDCIVVQVPDELNRDYEIRACIFDALDAYQGKEYDDEEHEHRPTTSSF